MTVIPAERIRQEVLSELRFGKWQQIRLTRAHGQYGRCAVGVIIETLKDLELFKPDLSLVPSIYVWELNHLVMAEYLGCSTQDLHYAEYLNDDLNLSLPQIADRLEMRWKERNDTNADVRPRT